MGILPKMALYSNIISNKKVRKFDNYVNIVLYLFFKYNNLLRNILLRCGNYFFIMWKRITTIDAITNNDWQNNKCKTNMRC